MSTRMAIVIHARTRAFALHFIALAEMAKHLIASSTLPSKRHPY